MTSDAVSVKGIKAQMPHLILTCVSGEPTHKQIKTVIHELLANLIAISCPWGHSKSHLGLLQDPAIYLAHNEEAFNIPHVKPPAYPVIPAGATTADREELRDTNAATCKAWNTYKMVLTITRDHLRRQSTTSTMLFLTTPPKVSMPSISAPLSCTSSTPTPRSANLIWMTT
jgi:hypothetical protein